MRNYYEGGQPDFASWKFPDQKREEPNSYHAEDEGVLQEKLRLLSQNMIKIRREANRSGSDEAEQAVREAERRRSQIIEALEKKRRVA